MLYRAISPRNLIVAIFSLSLSFLAVASTSNIHPAQQDNNYNTSSFADGFNKFATIFTKIKDQYVDAIGSNELFDKAIIGLVKELDPHSKYMTADELKQLNEDARGSFSGVGMQVEKQSKGVVVVSPIDGTPAHKANIQPGDIIIKIDGLLIDGMDLDKSVNLIRGKIDTSVTLTISRRDEIFDVDLIRSTIMIESIKGRLVSDNIGYIRISGFQKPTAKLLEDKINLFKDTAPNLDSLIVDLRNNPGGLLKSSIDILDLFLDKDQLIVYTQGQKPIYKFEYHSTRDSITNDIRLVVLINRGSASASEIVAGAIQDHNRGVIIGQQSFGKGSVQTISPFKDGSALKLTTSRYYTPLGRSIQAKGIVPDIILKNISIENNKKDEVINSPYYEKDLGGHLKSEGPVPKTVIKNKEKDSEIDELTNDYYIAQAINLLNGFRILGKK